jgi:CspA family cold shock protein
MTGTVKTKTEKGFGFITVDGQAKDVFFHSSSLQGISYDELREGDTVSFETEDSDRGPRAVNVSRA